MQELAKALAAAQAEMTSAEKDKVNPHFKSRYASLNALQLATRPVLSKHGLAISQTLAQTDGGLLLETRLMHESGDVLVSEFPVPIDGNIQKMGSYLTYAKRYCWSAICGIDGGDDDDGNGAAEQKPQAKKNGKTPKNWSEMMDMVNSHLPEPYYDTVPHFINAIIKQAGTEGIDLGNEERKFPTDAEQRRLRFRLGRDYALAKHDDEPLFDTQDD